MLHLRTDGNAVIGTGHMMRCMEIARAYEKHIGPVQFLVADEESKNFIESKGFSCYKLDSVWNDLNAEIPKLKQCKENCEITHLLIDSYFITEEYVKAWKQLGVKVAYLDDLCTKGYAFDALFNGAVWAGEEVYKGLYDKAVTKLYLGCDYLPIRQEFAGVMPKEVRKKAENVLVLSGGTDPCHFLKSFLENLPKDMEKEWRYYLVCGIFNEDYEEILKLAENRENIHILRNVSNLYEYMIQADAAISAGGMTLYELCACGTPAITYLLADNQQGNIEGFLEKDIFETIGDIRDGICFETLFSKLSGLLNDYENREKKARRIQKLVDGKGAYRIAKALESL